MNEMRWCGPCGTEQLFDVPPCEDSHGRECPEAFCVVCGHAILVGVVFEVARELVTRAA